MKNAVFCDGTRCGSYKNRRFGGTYRLHHQVYMNRRTRNVISHPVPLMMGAIRTFEAYVLSRATRRIIPDDGILLNNKMSP
jgi:hypothetical protein